MYVYASLYTFIYKYEYLFYVFVCVLFDAWQSIS
jgi:hypothetical protein